MQRFTIFYPDHSRQKVSKTRRDELIAAGLLKQCANHYLYTGPQRTLHSFSDLGQLSIAQQSDSRSYLEGQFIIERTVAGQTKRTRELMQTPYHLALSLSKGGQLSGS